ncbi:MAG: phage tail tape measure protein [Eggerthellaceae bacterium]|nr:phage tail tape measure protein [Eggerthellaceae bacterium]
MSSGVGTGYVNIVPKLSGVGALAGQLTAGLGSVGAAGAKAIGAAALAAGAGIGIFTKQTIDAGKQFDASMAQVAATMGKSMDDVRAESVSVGDFTGSLYDFAQQRGATTAFSASQAAEGLNYMALAGYKAEESIEMLPTVLNLAAAGSMELGAASDMVTDAQTALGLSMKETATMVDQMAAASSNTNTSVEQLGNAILTVGGTAKFMNGGMVTLADGTEVAADGTTELNTVLGILDDNGLKGSEAGTHLRNALLKMGGDEKTKTMMHDLGVEIFDAEGKMRSFSQIMPELSAAMADMTDEQKIEAFGEMFNVRDVATMNALLDTTAKRWNEVGAAIYDSAGAAEQMAETQLDNLEGDVVRFQSALEGVQIAIFNGLDPVLRQFVQTGTEGLSGLTSLLKDPGVIESISGIANSIIGGFTTATQVISDFGSGLFDNIDFEGFSTAFGNIGDTIAQNFGDGGQAASAKDFGKTFAEGINGLIPVIEAATPIIDGISQVIKLIADNSETAVPLLAALAGAFVVMNIASSVGPAIGAIAGFIGSIASRAIGAIAGLLGLAGAETAAGAASSASAGQIMAAAVAVIALGAGIALAAAGMYILASAAVMLADSGDTAIIMAAGLLVGVVGLVAVFAALGPMLTAGAVGMIAFGAAVLMVGAGVLIASVGVMLIAGVLPQVAAAGTPAAVAFAQLAGALILFGPAAIVAGAGAIVLGAGLTVCAAALTLAGGAATILAGAVVVIGAGMLLAGTAAKMMGDALPSIADNGGRAAIAIGELSLASGLAAGGLEAGAKPAKALADAVIPLGTASSMAAVSLLQISASLPGIASNGLPASVAVMALATAAGTAAPLLASAAPSLNAMGQASSAVRNGLSATSSELRRMSSSLTTVRSSSATTQSALVNMGRSANTAIASMSNSTKSQMNAISNAFKSTGNAVQAESGKYKSFANEVANNMNTANTVVSNAMSSIAATVSGTYLRMQRIDVGPLPHFSFSGDFDAKTKRVPTLNVSWYAKGGIIDGAQLIGAGEAGPELIWPSYSPYLSKYAEALASHIDGNSGDVYVTLNYTENDNAADMVRDVARGMKRLKLAGAF